MVRFLFTEETDIDPVDAEKVLAKEGSGRALTAAARALAACEWDAESILGLDFMRRFEASVHPERCLMFLTMATRVEKSALALAHLAQNHRAERRHTREYRPPTQLQRRLALARIRSG